MNRIAKISDLYASAPKNPTGCYQNISLESHRLLVALHEAWPAMAKLIEAAREIDRLLNDWDLIRQNSYAHQRLGRAIKALDQGEVGE